jgi:small subunit ribosomal protein S4e
VQGAWQPLGGSYIHIHGQIKKIGVGPKGVPFCTTHDGRTIRYPDPRVALHDTVVFDLQSAKISDYIKFDTGLCGLTLCLLLMHA